MRINTRKDKGNCRHQHFISRKNYRISGWKREGLTKASDELQVRFCREFNHISELGTLFTDAADEFLKYSARIGKSENRLRGLYSNFNSFLIPFFAHKRITDINYMDIESFIDIQLKRDITKKTIHHYITDLNALLNWALKEEIIHVNPMKKVIRKRIRPERIIKKGFTQSDIQKCESSLHGEERYFFCFLLFTGARLTEALSSRWKDVDYERREIVLRGTKTEGSLRTIEICNSLYDVLKELESYRTDSPYIFHHSNGKRILRRDKLFAKIKKATGIKITAKDLRDVFASTITMGSENNMPDIKTVSELLGHTNIATTQKYLFSFKEKKIKAVSVLDDVYGVKN